MAHLRIAAWLQIGAVWMLAQARFSPNWESLDAREQPEWFDQAKFGIFIHWGIFSVPAWGTEWYWQYLEGEMMDPRYPKHHEEMYGKDFKYQDFARQFTGKYFDAEKWADMFQKSGAKYVVLTAKHHEGFTMWPSKYSWNWNSVDIGPKRDVVREVTEAVRGKGLRMGLYHSLYEWFNTMYVEDKKNNFKTREYVERKVLPEMLEMVNEYKPDVIWSDGDWEAPAETYWGSMDFLAWLYNDSPVKDTVVTNDRWGAGGVCKHGDYYTGVDRQQASAKMLSHKWENCMTIDALSWGYSRNTTLTGYLTATVILQELSSTVAYGGNLLLNVGPTADGLILPIYEERLMQVGAFLKINGEAIFETQPWTVQNETTIEGAYYTAKHDAVYLMIVQNSEVWPTPGETLELKSLKKIGSAELLTAEGPQKVDCEDASGSVTCKSPCPFKAGLAKGAVHRLGFVLKFYGAEVADKAAAEALQIKAATAQKADTDL